LEGKASLLPPQEVHIWLTPLLDYKREVRYLASLLSQDEKERAVHFKYLKDQHNFIIARGILRRLLSLYLNTAPQEIEISYGLWGKPCLPIESLYFNLSHSRAYALYGFARDYEIGIDLEYIDESLDLEEMALNIFSPAEQKQWKKLNEKDKRQAFFKFWTRKEAYLKAMGKGWLQGEKEITLEKIDFFEYFSPTKFVKDKVGGFYSFDCMPGHASSLFVKGPSLCPKHYIYTHNFKSG
jgi:4'-phosphopantetheinyl transferase